jgi:hypothetical protein
MQKRTSSEKEMTEKKKVSEMTVRELLEEAKNKDMYEMINDPNFGLLQVLHKEGFSKEQVNEMKMEKAWKLYFDSIAVFMERMITQVYKGLERSPEKAVIIEPHLKKMIAQFEKWVKELEEKNSS